jgi:hypothetical protein
MRYFLLYLQLIFCGYLGSVQPNHFDNSALNSYCKQLINQKKWRLTATGRNNIENRVRLIFAGSQQLTLTQARVVFVEETQKLLTRLESQRTRSANNKSIDRLEFGVSFGPAGSYYHEPFVAYVFCLGNRVIYKKYDPELGYLVTTHEESYEEALAIVQGCDSERNSTDY